MLEKLVMLDEKGLVCPDNYSAEQHLYFSQLALDYSKSFALDDYAKSLLYQKGVYKLKKRIKMPSRALRKLKKCFNTDLSWAVTLRMKFDYFFGLSGAIVYGSPPTALPVISCSVPLKNIYVHEGVHLIRLFSAYSPGRDSCFEEAFAECTALFQWHDICNVEEMWKHIKAIKKTAKKLEDSLGKNSLYALSRLTMSEVYAVKESSSPLDTLKSFGMIRHQVMKARLGI